MIRMHQLFIATTAALSSIAMPALAEEPADGSVLSRTHVRFDWDDHESTSDFDLEVGIATSDPFGDPIISARTDESRHLVTEGLAFGTNYSWRVRPVFRGSPGEWSEARSFSIKNIPVDFQLEVEVQKGLGTPEPGITIFNHCDSIVGYDLDGNLVLHTQTPTRVGDCKVIAGGRLLYVGWGRTWILSPEGETLWASPDDSTLRAHHSASMMPSGNVLMVVTEYRDIEQDGVVRSWKGDRIVEIDPETDAIVWSWSTFDHYDTDDYDIYQPQHWLDWTHTNDAHYVEADNSVYISVRHLSRITRIDYDTKEIVYNIGMDMPSGDVSIGNDLFSYQHSPMLLENGNMLLLDNGNRRGGEPANSSTGRTFAVELELSDLPLTDATIAWSWEVPVYCPSTGDADRLANGNTLITATHVNGVLEATPMGLVTWRLNILAAETCSGYRPGYRATRVPNLFYLELETSCEADLSGDGDVGVEDLLAVIANWGKPYDVTDILKVIQSWGECL